MGQNRLSGNRYVIGKLFLTKKPKNVKGKGNTFQQMVLEQVAIHMKKKKKTQLESLFYIMHKH